MVQKLKYESSKYVTNIIKDIQDDYHDKFFVDGFVNALPEVEQGDTYFTHNVKKRERAFSVKKSRGRFDK